MRLILVDDPGVVPGDSRVIEPDGRLGAAANITCPLRQLEHPPNLLLIDLNKAGGSNIGQPGRVP